MRGVSAPAHDSGEFNPVARPLIRPSLTRGPPSPVPREKGCAFAILVIGVEWFGIPPSPACGRTQRGATDEGCLRPGAGLRRFSQVARPLIRPPLTRGPPSPVPREKGCALAILVIGVETIGDPPSPVPREKGCALEAPDSDVFTSSLRRCSDIKITFRLTRF